MGEDEPPSSYNQTGISGDCDADGFVTVAAGEHKTCTITNDDVSPIPPTLTVVKTVVNDNGGTATVPDFVLNIDDDEVESGVVNTTTAGSHTVSEENISGYSASNWGGDCAADGTVNLFNGQNKVCTITNNDIAPTLTVTKTVVNDNGGAKNVSDFLLFINGNPVTSGIANTLTAGILYTASETADASYTASAWGGDCAADGTITLAPGDTKSCTLANDDNQTPENTADACSDDADNDGDGFTDLDDPDCAPFIPESPTEDTAEFCSDTIDNDSDSLVDLADPDCAPFTPPTLTLVKTVTNDNGGLKQIIDFILKIGETAVTSGVASTLTPGSYAASEVNLSGYLATSWGDDCALDGTITLGYGDNKTCSITNDDVEPLLTVQKVVVNDNGGTANVSDFELFVNDTSVVSGIANGFLAGDYVVSETASSSYVATFSGACDAEGNVTLEVGDEKVCTITNDDVETPENTADACTDDADNDSDELTDFDDPDCEDFVPPYGGGGDTGGGGGGDGSATATTTLTVAKSVTNDDDGGKGPSDFSIHVKKDGVEVFGSPFAGSASGMVLVLEVGTYVVSETADPLYRLVSIGEDCSSDGTVTLATGTPRFCKLFNNDELQTSSSGSGSSGGGGGGGSSGGGSTDTGGSSGGGSTGGGGGTGETSGETGGVTSSGEAAGGTLGESGAGGSESSFGTSALASAGETSIGGEGETTGGGSEAESLTAAAENTGAGAPEENQPNGLLAAIGSLFGGAWWPWLLILIILLLIAYYLYRRYKDKDE